MGNLLALVLILGLASFRITWLWRMDTICEPLRQYLWSWLPPPPEADELVKTPRSKKIEFVPAVINGESGFIGLKATWIGTLTSCPWCVSAYVTLFFTFVAYFSTLAVMSFGGWFIFWLASWAACMLVYTHAEG